MDWKAGIAVIILACATSTNAYGAPSNENLLTACRHWERFMNGDVADMPEVEMCASYIDGFMHGVMSTDVWINNSQPKYFCPPQKSKFSQYRRMFLKWAANNPQRLHELAAEGLRESVIEKFPCEVSLKIPEMFKYKPDPNLFTLPPAKRD